MDLFYHRLPDSTDHMEVVTVSTHPDFGFGNPASVPMRAMRFSPPGNERNWDMMPDGRFIGLIDAPPSQSGSPSGRQINIVLNWFEELKEKVPVKVK